MTEVEELAETLLALIAAFESTGAAWALCGSLASTAYGEPRATNDIDVVAALRPVTARLLAERLAPSFYADPDVAADACRRASSFNAIHERTLIKVDVFMPGPGPLGLGQLDRRREIEVMPDVVVPVLGPEDTVMQKLRWYDLGGRSSDRQWRDLLSVVRAVDLDHRYLEEVARSGSLSDLLADLLDDAAKA